MPRIFAQIVRLACILPLSLESVRTFAAEPPPIPLALDAYRQWDKWPQQRIALRAYMPSTYDRSGGNEAADASHFLYQLAADRNATPDAEAPPIPHCAPFTPRH